MPVFHREREIVEWYHDRRPLAKVIHAGYVIYEKLVGFIFTKDGLSLNTKDGYIVKCKDQ